MGDVTTSVLHAALRGLAQRQRVIADNVANLNTPGYLAGRVDFESHLLDASSPTVSRSLAPTKQDGNNVNLDEETVEAVKANLEYQTMVEAMNAKFRLLRTAIRGDL